MRTDPEQSIHMCLSCGISHRSRFIPLMFKSELLSPDYTEASTATEASEASEAAEAAEAI